MHLPPTILNERHICFQVVRPFVRLSDVHCWPFNTSLFSPDTIISVLSGGISVKLARKLHHMSGHCWRDFHGQKSKVKVKVRWNALFRLPSVRCLSGGGILNRRRGVDADLFTITSFLSFCQSFLVLNKNCSGYPQSDIKFLEGVKFRGGSLYA